MKQCAVYFVDTNGIRHSVAVQADSMYEAAAAALETFREHECSPGVASQLEIQVRSPVTHTLAMKKLKGWADLAGGSPRHVILKGRMKRVLARDDSITRARDSHRDGRAGGAFT